MILQENIPFSKFCSLSISDRARFYCEVKGVEELTEVLNFCHKEGLESFVIGEGTNLVATQPFRGVIVRNSISGIHKLNELTIEVASGENWNDFVRWTLKNELFGLENLALIPGTVGAGPTQNIGAYGSEISKYIKSISTIDRRDGSNHVFTQEECEFGYRTSIFKKKRDLFILSVTFNLSKIPRLNYSYDSLKEQIDLLGFDEGLITPWDIYKVVSDVRNRKLPDHQSFPNVGSFFKNVYLSKEEFLNLDLPFQAPVFKNEKLYKIPAAFILQETGWKGKRIGNIGMSDLHSLVLVTYEEVKGEEILLFAKNIIDDVYNKTGLRLEIEPTIL